MRMVRFWRSTKLVLMCLRFRGAVDGAQFGRYKLRRAVPTLVGHRTSPVVLHQHGVVDLGTEGIANSLQVGCMAVSGQLDPVGEPAGDIGHEHIRVVGVTLADLIGHDQLGLGIDGSPRPHVAMAQAYGK